MGKFEIRSYVDRRDEFSRLREIGGSLRISIFMLEFEVVDMKQNFSCALRSPIEH